MRRPVLATLIVLTAAAGAAGCGGSDDSSGPRVPTGPFPTLPQQASLPGGGDLGRVFAPGAIWNEPLPRDVELDPNSRQLSDALAAMARQGTSLSVNQYSVPVYVVGPDQPRVRVVPGAQNPSLREPFAEVPLPDGARPAAGTDKHLVVYQPSTDTMWEFWKLRREADGWHANYGGRMVDVSKNPGYFVNVTGPGGRPLERSFWGATATGLPLVGGLIEPQELQRGQIDHALALAVPRVRAGVRALPAQRADGRFPPPFSIPEGARFRIDPSLDLEALGLPRATLTMARAAQRYGMIVRDGGGRVAIYARDPVNLEPNPYPELLDGLRPYQVLQDFPWDSLELVRMRLRPDR